MVLYARVYVNRYLLRKTRMYKRKTVPNKVKLCGKKQLRVLFLVLALAGVSIFVMQRYQKLSEINKLLSVKPEGLDSAGSNALEQDGAMMIDPVDRVPSNIRGHNPDPRDKFWLERREEVKKVSVKRGEGK